jgi:hypothetical protein
LIEASHSFFFARIWRIGAPSLKSYQLSRCNRRATGWPCRAAKFPPICFALFFRGMQWTARTCTEHEVDTGCG